MCKDKKLPVYWFGLQVIDVYLIENVDGHFDVYYQDEIFGTIAENDSYAAIDLLLVAGV